MPPKKKKITKKKKAAVKKAVEIPEDNKLPLMPNNKNATIVHAVATSDVQCLNRLVAHYNYGNNLNSVDLNGSTPLHIAVKKNDPKMLQALIFHKKIDVNALEVPSIGGYAALHHACLGGFLNMMQILISQARANVNIRCNSIIGETPLLLCCKLGFTECAKLLLSSGASLDVKDKFGNNASFWAAKYRQDTLARELNLPPPKSPDALEFLALLRQHNPKFSLPTIKAKKGKAKKDKKGKK